MPAISTSKALIIPHTATHSMSISDIPAGPRTCSIKPNKKQEKHLASNCLFSHLSTAFAQSPVDHVPKLRALPSPDAGASGRTPDQSRLLREDRRGEPGWHRHAQARPPWNFKASLASKPLQVPIPPMVLRGAGPARSAAMLHSCARRR